MGLFYERQWENSEIICCHYAVCCDFFLKHVNEIFFYLHNYNILTIQVSDFLTLGEMVILMLFYFSLARAEGSYGVVLVKL